jgi:hypothetical protein
MYKEGKKNTRRRIFYSGENSMKIKRIMNFQSFVLNPCGMHKMVRNTEKWVTTKILLNMCMENLLA